VKLNLPGEITCSHGVAARHAEKAIPGRTWFVEVVFLAIAVLLWRDPPSILATLVGAGSAGFLGVVVVIDMEHRLILHPVSVFGAGLGLVTGTGCERIPTLRMGLSWLSASAVLNPKPGVKGLGASLLGGAVGFGIMWVLYSLGDKLVRDIAKRRGQPTEEVALGFGDVNLSGVPGIDVGWRGHLRPVHRHLHRGIVSLLYLRVDAHRPRYHLFTALPYGPYLIAGAVITFIFFRAGDQLLEIT